MTYCVGIKVRDGLVALADGRLTSGNQVSTARKMSVLGAPGANFFIMSSGLRSVRDKTLAFLEREMNRHEGHAFATVFDAVKAYCECLRQVKIEDQQSLEASSLSFNMHGIIGGQLLEDRVPDLYLVYPEGNWIRVDERTPYLSIGATAYGKPILDRALRFDTDLGAALKLAYLSFDSTRYSSSDVGFPIDMATLPEDRMLRCASFDYEDLIEQRQWWNKNITELARRLPDGPWLGPLTPHKEPTER